MRCLAIFFLLVGAFLFEWHERGITSAWKELKLYWSTRSDPDYEEY